MKRLSFFDCQTIAHECRAEANAAAPGQFGEREGKVYLGEVDRFGDESELADLEHGLYIAGVTLTIDDGSVFATAWEMSA